MSAKFLSLHSEIKTLAKFGTVSQDGRIYRAERDGKTIEILTLANGNGIEHIRANNTYWMRVKYAAEATA